MKIKTLLIAAFVPLLFACSDDDGEADSGAGLESDGGAQSSQYAGTYRGQIVGQAKASGVGTSNFSEPVTVVINKNGTLSMTIDDTTVSGVMNNNQMEARINLTISKSWGKCDTYITVKGTVNGRRLDGPVNGTGDCRYLGIPRSATLTGNFTSTRR